MMYILQVFLAIIVLAGLSVWLMLYCRNRIGIQKLRMNHEVAGFVYAVVGTIFAVTIALIVDTVHDEYLLAERRVANEAFQLSNLHQLARMVPRKRRPGPAAKLVTICLCRTGYGMATVPSDAESRRRLKRPRLSGI